VASTYWIYPIALLFLIVLDHAHNPQNQCSQSIRILPLGDSITQGGQRDRQEYTYRYPLFYLLNDAGHVVDFIGSQRTGLHPDAVWPDKNGVPFDLDHEGHYGWRTAQIRDHLSGWTAEYPAAPDIVLVHLGSNDIRVGEHFYDDVTAYNETIIRPLKDIVAILRKHNPRVVVLVGHIAQNGVRSWIVRQMINWMVWRTSTHSSPIETVAHHRNWRADPDHSETDTFDWAHPNPKGQQKMAELLFAKVVPYLPPRCEIGAA